MTKSSKKVILIQEGENGPIFTIEVPESYSRRKNISASRSSSVKKIQRIDRVRRTGFKKTPATATDIAKYGPPMVMEPQAA